MNIQREFLHTSTEKFIPVNLMRSSYGVAESNPSGDFVNEDFGVHITEIRFPSNSSNLVFMLDYGTKDVVQVYASPPGTVTVNLEVKEGKTYSVYVVSKEYTDGFIGGDFSVNPNIFSSDQLELNYDNNPPTLIDLTVEGAMSLSLGRDDTNPNEWYNYGGSYTNNILVWDSPTVGNVQLQAKNYWLVIREEILAQINNIFSQVNLTSFNPNSKSDVVKMFKVMDLVAEFMRDKKDYYDEILGSESQNIQDIWSFLNSNLPGYEYNKLEFTGDRYYWAFDENLSDVVDALGVYCDYIRWDGFHAQGGDSADIQNSRDQQARYVSATNVGLDHNSGPNPSIQLDLSGLNDNERHKGVFNGGREVRLYINGAWDRFPYTQENQQPWFYVWLEFQNKKVPWIEEWNQRVGDVYGLPIHETAAGVDLTSQNRDWWRGTTQYSQNIWDNVREWLDEKLNENQTLMAQAGDSIWSGYTFEDTVLVGYGTFDTSSPRPDWFNVHVPWTQEVYSNSDRAFVPESSGSYDPDWIWGEVVRQGYIGSTRQSWNPTVQMDLDGPDYFYTGTRTSPNQTRHHKTSDWNQVVSVINNNLNSIYPPIYSGVSGGTSIGGSPISSGETNSFPVAHNAVLQNIRFLKNLVKSVDENIWAALTNSSALMLSNVLSIKEEIDRTPETHSILNITNAVVPPNTIEVLWKKIGYTEWTPLQTTIEDIGNNVVMVNLNGEDFNGVGKYLVMLQPRHITVDVERTQDNYAIVSDDLNSYESPNYFYGYNAQLYTPQGAVQGGQKIVIESKWKASEQWLKLSPIVTSLADFGEDLKLELWGGDFIPVMIEIDIVEHNSLTLSYASYGDKELWTESGVCKIYDYAGNVYKTLTLGRYSNASTGNEIVEYRSSKKNPH